MTADLIAAVAAVAALLGAYWARQAAQRTTVASVQIAAQLLVHTQYSSRNPDAPEWVRTDAR
jgi:hypothetical protein